MKRGKIIYLIVMGLLISGGEALAGTLPYTFTAGTKARAAEVNANFDALESRLTTLENMESGSTTSDGSADKSPQAPDTSTCSTGSCIIGSTSYLYPSGNWVYVARYTPQTEGFLTVTSGPALVCNENVSPDTQLEVSISVAEATSFPPSNPAQGVIGTATVTIPSPMPSNYSLRPWDYGEGLIEGRLATAGVLTPGTTYKILLYAEVLSGSTAGNCAFVESPITLTFMPTKGVDITPTP